MKDSKEKLIELINKPDVRQLLANSNYHNLTFREELEYRIGEIKSAYRSIKTGLKNLWTWRKVIFNDRYFDHHYLYEILEFKLKLMADGFEKNNILESSGKTVLKIRELIKWIKLVKTEFEEVEYEDLSEYLSVEEFNDWLKEKDLLTYNTRLKTGYIRAACRDKYRKLLFKELEENIELFWD